MAVMFTSSLPVIGTGDPRTSAAGEKTRRYSHGRSKLDPSSKAMVRTRERAWRLISVGWSETLWLLMDLCLPSLPGPAVV